MMLLMSLNTGVLTMTLAAIALHAVAHRHSWGAAAARRHATTRGAGALYRLACQLEAVAQ